MRLCKILLLISIFFSCNNGKLNNNKANDNEIQLSNTLNLVISNFHQNRCIQGVPSVMIHSFCDGEIAEIWCTTGWSELEGNMPSYYTTNKGFIYLIFNNSSFFPDSKMNNKQISKLVETQLEQDLGLPPRTEFSQRWLYRLDYPSNEFYSMVDSLFKYDNNINFNNNLYSYTGQVICY